MAYHGSNAKTAQSLLGGSEFLSSENSYDWLGSGVYFWENDPMRALQWARKRWEGIETPSVIGAVVDLGLCLDLTMQEGIEAVRSAHRELVAMHKISREPLPENAGSERGHRMLDCAVINHLHRARKRVAPNSPFQTVRALFVEGAAVYDGAGFHDRTHIQLCVIDQLQIQGVFRLPKWQQTLLGIDQDIYS